MSSLAKQAIPGVMHDDFDGVAKWKGKGLQNPKARVRFPPPSFTKKEVQLFSSINNFCREKVELLVSKSFFQEAHDPFS